MLEVLLIAVIVLLLVILIILLRLRSNAQEPAQMLAQLGSLEKGLERVDRSLRDEVAKNRQEAREDARSQRDEVSASLKGFNDSIFKVVSETSAGQKLELTAFGKSLQAQVNGIASLMTGQLQTFSGQLTALTNSNEEKLESLHDGVDVRLQFLQTDNGVRLDQIREETKQDARSQRDEISASLKNFNDSILKVLRETSAGQTLDLTAFGESLHSQVSGIASLTTGQLQTFSGQLTGLTKSNEEKLESLREGVDMRLKSLQTDNGARLDHIREETKQDARSQRDELNASLKNFNESLLKGLGEMSESQRTQSQSVSQSMEIRFDALRETVDGKFKDIQQNNAAKLEEMRLTVDEKLHGTLEKRLGEAFNQVTGQLEQVHKGLGEMQTLAAGVGDLKRALTNVRTRGAWGEVQLGALLEDMLSPTQFDRNFKPKENGDTVVEYAIRFPSRDGSGESVWLPIDSKFPIEDYNRLVEAQERADLEAIDLATKGLELRIKGCAKDISEKYLHPPRTTDFGIMFLPTEGLYAEVIRRTNLVEALRREYNVTIVGPSTFAAFVNSLQMGFRTLAIQERSNEVWKVLGAVKNEFGKFGGVLERVKKKLEQATSTMDDAATRSRAIERKLKDVAELPSPEAQVLLGVVDLDPDTESQSENSAVEMLPSLTLNTGADAIT